MTGSQKSSITVFLMNEGRVLLKCIGDKMISPSFFMNGSFDPDTLGYVQDKLLSEYGMTTSSLEEPKLRYITLRVAGDELRENFFYFAETRDELGIPPIGNLKWIPYGDVVSMEMPKTVQGVLKHYLEIGRSNDRVYCGVVKQKGVAISELEEF